MAPNIVHVENEALSSLLPRAALILCSATLAIVLMSNFLERWFLGRLYPAIWGELSLSNNERRRRSFTYFHIGVSIMITLIIFGAYPVFGFLVGRVRVSYILFGETTYGDYMLVLSQIYSAYYLFELCFRTRFASAISIAHHVGLLIVIQTALALFGDLQKHPEAILEFYMCMVWGKCVSVVPCTSPPLSSIQQQCILRTAQTWSTLLPKRRFTADSSCSVTGAFDVVIELPLYTFMIIWRVKSYDRRLLSRLAYICCVWVILGATTETAITIWLLNCSWSRWSLPFRILLPLVFSLWISTQLYGAFRIYGMARTTARLASLRGEENQDSDNPHAASIEDRKSNNKLECVLL
jgi:hypothetical protein